MDGFWAVTVADLFIIHDALRTVEERMDEPPLAVEHRADLDGAGAMTVDEIRDRFDVDSGS